MISRVSGQCLYTEVMRYVKKIINCVTSDMCGKYVNHLAGFFLLFINYLFYVNFTKTTAQLQHLTLHSGKTFKSKKSITLVYMV